MMGIRAQIQHSYTTYTEPLSYDSGTTHKRTSNRTLLR